MKVEGHSEVCHCHRCQDPCKTVTEPMPFSREEADRLQQEYAMRRLGQTIIRDVKDEAD